MRHLILWMQGVGGGAGVHREGQHDGLQQVCQEHVQKYRWHIKTFVSIIARLMGLSTRSTLTRTTRWASTSTARRCSKVNIAHLKWLVSKHILWGLPGVHYVDFVDVHLCLPVHQVEKVQATLP